MPPPTPIDLQDPIRAAVADEMERRGLTQSQLARLAGIPSQTVCRFLSGARGLGPEHLASVLRALDLRAVVAVRRL